MRKLVVRFFYATHADSAKVRRKLSALCDELKAGDWGVNIGASDSTLHPQIVNLDVREPDAVQIVTRGQRLPFDDNSLTLAVSQEVIEHLPNPALTISEVMRVLKPGGKFYCQAPFTLGFHPGPNDYWRFTKQGMAELFADPRWQIIEIDTSVGHGTGAYRILVELFAVTASILSRHFYIPAKGIAAILLSPIKLLDLVSDRSSQSDRIPGGYYIIAEKV